MGISLGDIINTIKGTLISGSPDFAPLQDHHEHMISDIAPLTRASATELSFFTNVKYKKELPDCQAFAIITREKLDIPQRQILHPNPYAAMALISQMFHQTTHSFTGISDMAAIDPSSHVDPGATVYPFAYIGPRCHIGKGSVIYPHTTIVSDCEVGSDTVIYPNVVIMPGSKIGSRCIIHGGCVIGADGFGFAPQGDRVEKIPQIGTVHIGDDVEMGSNATVDRAAFDVTHLQEGVKLDSHVHVGHNANVGPYTMLCALVGVAGGAQIGRRVIAGGQTGIGPSIKIGDYVVLGPQTGIVQDELTAGEYYDMPHIPASLWRKQKVLGKKLPDLFEDVRQLKQQIAQLTSTLQALKDTP